MSKGKFNISQLLNTKPGGAEAGEESTRRAQLKIVSISVHKLLPSKDNFYSDENITGLKTSIEMFGVKQNLTVKLRENGMYEIIAGHRRRKACLELVNEGKPEFEYVPCGIETERDEIKERILLIMTNSTARTLTDWEKMKQAEELRAYCEAWKERDSLPGRVRDMVAEIMQESATQIARLNAIAGNLTPEFQGEMKEGRLGVSAAYELSALPEDKQREAYQDYTATGAMSIKDAKALKDETEPAPPARDPWVEKHIADMEEKGREIEEMLAEDEAADASDPEGDETPEDKDFADMTAEEKGMAAIEFLEGSRFKLFPPGADTRIFEFIIDMLEHHVLR